MCRAGIEVISCVSHTLYNTEDICAKSGGHAPLSYKVGPSLPLQADFHLTRRKGYCELGSRFPRGCFELSVWRPALLMPLVVMECIRAWL